MKRYAKDEMIGMIKAWAPIREEKSNDLRSDCVKGREARMDTSNGGKAAFKDDFTMSTLTDEGTSSLESI